MKRAVVLLALAVSFCSPALGDVIFSFPKDEGKGKMQRPSMAGLLKAQPVKRPHGVRPPEAINPDSYLGLDRHVQKTLPDGTVPLKITNTSPDPVRIFFSVENDDYQTIDTNLWRSTVSSDDGAKDQDVLIVPPEMNIPKTVWFQFKTTGKHYLCWKLEPVTPVQSKFNERYCRSVWVQRSN